MPIGSKLAEQKLRASILLWGREGTGKTTSGLRLTECGPGNVVLVNAEGGAKMSALRAQGVDVDRVEVWPPDDKGPGYMTFDTLQDEVIIPMREALEKDPNSYVGLVVDSFTELSRRLLGQAAGEARIKAARLGKARDRFQITLEDHGTSAAMMRDLLRDFRDLPCHLVITALERRDVDQDSGRVTYGPAMGPAVGTDTMGLVDLVGFCQVEEIGETPFRTATFQPTPIRRAKDRFGVLPIKLADPFADRIVGYIDGTITKDNDPARQRVLAAAAAVAEETAAEAQSAPDAGSESTEAEETAPDEAAA